MVPKTVATPSKVQIKACTAAIIQNLEWLSYPESELLFSISEGSLMVSKVIAGLSVYLGGGGPHSE